MLASLICFVSRIPLCRLFMLQPRSQGLSSPHSIGEGEQGPRSGGRKVEMPGNEVVYVWFTFFLRQHFFNKVYNCNKKSIQLRYQVDTLKRSAIIGKL